MDLSQHDDGLASVLSAGTEVTDVTRYFYIQAAKDLGGFKTVAPADINSATTSIGGANGLQINCGGTLDASNTAMRTPSATFPRKQHHAHREHRRLARRGRTRR